MEKLRIIAFIKTNIRRNNNNSKVFFSENGNKEWGV